MSTATGAQRLQGPGTNGAQGANGVIGGRTCQSCLCNLDTTHSLWKEHSFMKKSFTLLLYIHIYIYTYIYIHIYIYIYYTIAVHFVLPNTIHSLCVHPQTLTPWALRGVTAEPSDRMPLASSHRCNECETNATTLAKLIRICLWCGVDLYHIQIYSVLFIIFYYSIWHVMYGYLWHGMDWIDLLCLLTA